MDSENTIDLSTYRSQDEAVYGETNRKIIGAKDYDLVDDGSKINRIGGKMPKKFVRMSKHLFSEYFSEKEKGTAFYGTCFSNDEKEEYLPKLIPSLAKMCSTKKQMIYETYVPRILNYFKIPAAFNVPCKDVNGYSYVASIDFIKPDERFTLLTDIRPFNGDFGYHGSLKESLDYVGEVIQEFYKEKNMKLTSEVFEQHMTEFVKSYFVRVMLLGDCDFSARNYGVLYNEQTNTLRMAPNFDFELCFRPVNMDLIRKDLEFLEENFPELTKELIDTTRKLVKDKRGVRDCQSIYNKLFKPSKIGKPASEFVEEGANDLLTEYAKLTGKQENEIHII